jgi:hypothetical protein
MLRLSICLALVFILGCESAAEKKTREARESAARFLAAGRVTWKAGEKDEAIKLFSSAIAAYPSTGAYNERANAYVLMDQEELAAADVAKGLKIDPLHTGLLEVRALLKQRKTDREAKIAAEQEMERARVERLAEIERDRIARERAIVAEKQRAAMRQRAQADKNAHDAFNAGWAKIPKAVDLPADASEHATIRLPAVPNGMASFSLQLSGDPEFVLQRVPDGQAWAVLRGKSTVGSFTMSGSDLEFAWDKSASRPADELRLCTLELRAAGQTRSVELRSPIRRPALDISFAKDVTIEPLPITDTPAEDLLLEFVSIQGIPGTANPTRVAYNVPMHVVLVAATNAEAGVELTLKLIKKKDQPAVEMRPYIIDTNSKTFPLSLKRLDTMAKRVEHELPRAQVDLANMQDAYVGLQAMAAYLTAKLNEAPLPLLPTVPGFDSIARMNPRDPAEKTKIQLKLNDIAQDLGDLTRRIKSKTISVNRMTGQQVVLPKLASIGATADNSASLRLRVLKQSAGREIEIMTLDHDSFSSQAATAPAAGHPAAMRPGERALDGILLAVRAPQRGFEKLTIDPQNSLRLAGASSFPIGVAYERQK